MALVTLAEILAPAKAGGYAVGAFNVHSLDAIPAVVEVAVQERSPIILQVTEGTLQFCGQRSLQVLAGELARGAPVPVALHYDHGASVAAVARAIQAGFSSVMIDASDLPFDENVAVTRGVVALARACGLSVEAELGRVGGNEEGEEGGYTDPGEAARFVAETGVDALAVAVGSAHGRYRREPRLAHHLLEQLQAQVAVPLVLHGGSGVPDEEIRGAIARGIHKINVATEGKEAWAQALRASLAGRPEVNDPRTILAPAKLALQAVVRQKIRLFGSAGHA